jgi:formamidopyrimidine-DNA glycosylase
VPERPDLEYVVPILDRELRGVAITDVRVKKPVVLRIAVPGTPQELLIGQTFHAVHRRAHFVLFELSSPNPLVGGHTVGGAATQRGADPPKGRRPPVLELAVSPMLAGRFALVEHRSRAPADVAVTWQLSDGRELRYRDDVQMGKVYLIARGAWQQVPGLATIGVDVLDARAFTRETFRTLARQRRDQVKVFLMDKTVLDAMGNAYADEVLWEARLHPKQLARKLSDAELDRLHDAIVSVLGGACATVAARRPPLDEKVRDFLNVRGRAGQPCPRCGTKIRTARVHADDAHFCPHCQPDVRGTSIVDWSKVTKKF